MAQSITSVKILMIVDSELRTKEKLMKSRRWIISACGLLLTVSTIFVEAQYGKIAQAQNGAATNSADPQSLKCPKCQGEFEQGLLLNSVYIPESRDPIKNATEWALGSVKGGFLPGVKVKAKRPLVALCCSKCGYVELYAR
jgi:predicted nucleic-acid-binding Zn-ribbon protein